MHASILVKWCLITFDALWPLFWVLPFSRISMDILGVRCPPAKPMPRPAMPMPALEAIGPPSTHICAVLCMTDWSCFWIKFQDIFSIKHLEYKKHAQWVTNKKSNHNNHTVKKKKEKRKNDNDLQRTYAQPSTVRHLWLCVEVQTSSAFSAAIFQSAMDLADDLVTTDATNIGPIKDGEHGIRRKSMNIWCI